MITKLKTAIKDGWRWQLAVFIAGALLPLSFSPFDLWPVAIVSLSVLAVFLSGRSLHQTIGCGSLFAFGAFGSGIHWLIVPIYQFSSIPTIFAVVIIYGGIIFGVALFFALPFYIFGRWCNKHPLSILIGLPAIWVMTEWLRTWLLTGFPWLFLGYSQTDTWLAGWAPITGVMGISFIVCYTASSIAYAWLNRSKKIQAVGALSLSAVFWLGGLALAHIQWTQSYAKPVSVGLAQGNISPDKKWLPSYLEPTIERYYSLSEDLWDNDWVIWPEAAIPLIVNYTRHSQDLEPLWQDLREKSIKNNSAFITGILYASPQDQKIYNSMIATGLGSGIYLKQHLVPLGEYLPLEEYLGDLLNFFNIPRSMVALGPPNQHGLQVGNAMLSPSICYEIVFPDLIAQGAKNSNVLITISNDAWFGNSIGPYQHMQMARMRALETQRYLIRGTNNGVSALVNDRGKFIVRSKHNAMDSIEGEVELRQGDTPFMVFGSEPIVFLSLVILGVLGFVSRKKKSS